MLSKIKLFFISNRAQKVSGRDITPFVLDKLRQLTAGASLRASILLCTTTLTTGSRMKPFYLLFNWHHTYVCNF